MNFEIETVPSKGFSLESENLDVGIRLVEELQSSGREGKEDITPQNDEMAPSHALFINFPSPSPVHSSHSRGK